MMDEIKKKVKDNPFCDLSIAELIELSKLSYNELLDIFGKNLVAHFPQEINENTICYVGDLEINYRNKELPIYNLRYIFGFLEYQLSEISKLENLCFVKLGQYIKGNMSYLENILDNND